MQSTHAGVNFSLRCKPINVVRRHMLLAMVPGIFCYSWFFGVGLLFNLGAALFTTVCVEAVWSRLQQSSILSGLADFDSLMAATILSLSIPSIAPWWIIVSGCTCAVVIKHFLSRSTMPAIHPAMASYCLLLLVVPSSISNWPTPQNITPITLTIADFVSTFFNGELPERLNNDGITSATPLQTLKPLILQKQDIRQVIKAPIFGNLGGVGWEWLALAYLCGGLWLVYRDIINWSIPAGLLGGLTVFAIATHAIDATYFPSVQIQIFSGATMLSAFFIATDPNTSPKSVVGGFVFGVIISSITFILRITSIYPEGMAFAVVLANLMTPWLSTWNNTQTI